MTVANGVCLLGFVAAVMTGYAQEPGTQPRAGVPVEKPRIEPAQEIKATGCLAREEDRFILKDVAVEITPWLAPTVRKDGVGASKPSPSKTVFALLNSQGLSAHLGQRVEVTGVVAPATANLPPSPDTTTARGFTGVPQPTFPGPIGVPRIAHPNLDNKGIRRVAAGC